MNRMTSILRLLTRLRAAGTESMAWMAPRHECCLICGKVISHSHAKPISARSKAEFEAAAFLHQALCGGCYTSIPWLDRIVCPTCGRAIRCEDCDRRPSRHFILNRSAVSYNSVMRDWLALYKYRGNESLAPLLSKMLVRPFLRMTGELARSVECSAAVRERERPTQLTLWQRLIGRPHSPSRPISRYWDAVTFVPISAQRAEERGFNQAKEMARYLSDRFGIPLFDLLTRAHHSEKMSFKSRAERIRAAKSLFEINEATLRELESMNSPEELRILLVDDIYTTGSTVEACSEVLWRHSKLPIQVYVLTWSRS